MTWDVRQTRIASAQAAGLRGRAKRAYESFLDELHVRACAALGYRLTGPVPLEKLCVKHLYGADRVVVAFAPDGEVWVLLIGPHHGDPNRNVYDLLYKAVGTVVPDQQARTKPPCCDQGTDEPPDFAASEVDDLLAHIQRAVRTR